MSFRRGSSPSSIYSGPPLSSTDLIALVYSETTLVLFRVHPHIRPPRPFTCLVSYSVSGFQRFQKLHPDRDPWRPPRPAAVAAAEAAASGLAPGVGGTLLSLGLSSLTSARGKIN